MKSELQKVLDNGVSRKKVNRKIAKNLRRRPKREVDEIIHQEHETVFAKIDCLECANCCKTTSPIFKDSDIRRISASLRMKDVDFISTYLKLDSESDYVLQKSPCAFLENDNTCRIYDSRPQACKGYPHTHRKNVRQILDLALKNTEICPAVAQIFTNLNRLSG